MMMTIERTAQSIRQSLKGEGRVYIRQMFTTDAARVFDARERRGVLQVKTQEGWHEVLIGDELWAQGD